MRVGAVVAVVGVLWGATFVPAGAATFRIEIDWMANANHSHRPSQAVIDAVVQMFACRGHTLIIDLDEQIPHYNVLRRNPEDCDASLFSYDGSADSFGALRDEYFDNGGDWHYCIFAHQYENSSCNTTGSSGLGQRPGRYFIVTLGGFDGQTGTPFEQAATLAHEFGHNLGLTHCGDDDCVGTDDDTNEGNYNPILPSIMSYRYQLAGVRTNLLCNGLAPPESLFKEIDYSDGRMCSLRESSLNEVAGTYMASVDWDCSGTLTSGVQRDVSNDRDGWCSGNGAITRIDDKGEWSTVSSAALQLDTAEPQEEECITAAEWEMVQAELIALGGCPQPILQVEPCVPGRHVFIGPPTFITTGSCNIPFGDASSAQEFSPNQSVYFFKPGTYNETGLITLDKPGIWMCPTGLARVQ